MTTHYEKIQALGNRMASNLETMGVSASFSDGGLTLADKILQIQRFNSGLMVYADKDIAQSGNTVNISALLMKNGKAVSGERVILKGLNSEVTVGSTDVSINTDYMITLNTEATFNIRDSNNVYVIFMYYSNSWQIKIGSGSSTPIGDGVVFIESGAVKYYDSNNVLQTVSDFTGAVMNSSNGANNTAYPIWVGTTGSDGVVSKSYTCSGAGLKTITAESGTLQSEPYMVHDCLMFDDGVTSPKPNSWTNPSSLGVSVDTTNGTTVSNTGSSSAYYISKLPNTSDSGFNVVWDAPLCVEFDLTAYSGSASFQVGGGGTGASALTKAFSKTGHYKIEIKADKYYVYIDDDEPVSSNSNISAKVSIRFVIGASGSMTFKNYEAYPI